MLTLELESMEFPLFPGLWRMNVGVQGEEGGNTGTVYMALTWRFSVNMA